MNEIVKNHYYTRISLYPSTNNQIIGSDKERCNCLYFVNNKQFDVSENIILAIAKYLKTFLSEKVAHF